MDSTKRSLACMSVISKGISPFNANHQIDNILLHIYERLHSVWNCAE